MVVLKSVKRLFHAVRYFFPLALIVNHVKLNLVGLLYWILFLLIVTDNFGRAFGIPFLFLSPEYQGEISGWSFALLGFAFGGFTMAFNSYSYIRIGPEFPFLAMVYKPFLKFCLNNSVIPLLFNCVYLFKMAQFQRAEEFATTGMIWGYIGAYLAGNALFIGGALMYFFPANKNFYDLTSRAQPTSAPAKPSRWSRLSQGKTMRYAAEGKHPIYWYIGKGFRIHRCRSTRHYSPVLLQKVFAQNRISTTIFEIATVLTFVLLGLFGGKSVFDVPAAMSIVMLLTIILMLFSALVSWLRRWVYLFLIGLIFLMNYFSTHWDLFQFENQAYGLNYQSVQTAPYTTSAIQKALNDKKQITLDSLNQVELLENWKNKSGMKKPVLVVINTSGGGTRSAAWTFEVMRYCDSLTAGGFSRNIALITGASGGMLGASYYRSLLIEKKKDKSVNLNKSIYFNRITEDLLNKLSFAASTNDIFFRYQTRDHYNYDRGMAFEDDLNENTHGVLDHRLDYFKKAEREGEIPQMIFSPTIVNDGRRLLISSQGLAFMTGNQSDPSGTIRSYENIDIRQLLDGKQSDKLRFTSVLRMNATFPFVLPMVTLPTNPKVQVMDAGTRDNFGVKTMVQWLNAMRDWITQHTSGVVVVQIRDTRKVLEGDEVEAISLIDKFYLPFSNMYDNFPRTQDFDQEEVLKMMAAQRDFHLKIIALNLRERAKDRISLSWHLTSKEKIKIQKAIFSAENQRGIKRVIAAIAAKKKNL